MKILTFGDVVGPAAFDYLCRNLRKVKLQYDAEMVIVNGENLTNRSDIDKAGAQRLFDSGADVITGGNHSFSRDDVLPMLQDCDTLLRPANYSGEAPGKGCCIFWGRGGIRILVLNLAGRLFMNDSDDPFACCEKLLKMHEGQYDFAVCDLHAEATAEKIAFFRCFDGRISVMFGTHTHVQTADETLTDRGSAFITDLGMCGAYDSVLGLKTEQVIQRFRTGIRRRTEPADADIRLCGAVFEVDERTGIAKDVKRICITKG